MNVEATRPEVELLLSCARSQINPENIVRIKELCKENIDWEYLLRMAGRHGLMPLLYQNLNSICPEDVPEGIFNKLKNHFNANTGYNLFLTGELLKLLNLFETHGIPAVAFKGPVLASSVYRNLALREFVDLDILIHKKDIWKVKELLLSQGFRPLFQLTLEQEEAFLKSQCEYPFFHYQNGVNIEILWKFVPERFPFKLNLEHLWESLKKISLAGKEVLTIPHDDLLILLCIHGFKHHWERMGWICDIAELIRVHQKMEWQQIIEKARSLDAERILFLGLYLVNKLLGVVLPDKILQRMEADPVVKSLAAKVCENLFQDDYNPVGIFKMSLFHLRSIEHLLNRVRYCFYFVIQPTLEDYELFVLPRNLFFFYYLIRPFRILQKYGLSLLKIKTKN